MDNIRKEEIPVTENVSNENNDTNQYYEIDYTLFDETSIEFYMSIQEVTLCRPATK